MCYYSVMTENINIVNKDMFNQCNIWGLSYVGTNIQQVMTGRDIFIFLLAN